MFKIGRCAMNYLMPQSGKNAYDRIGVTACLARGYARLAAYILLVLA
ncbi:MAG: hypothetical protein JWR25_2431 [Noviherbaspirillum sp.]|nr:hypothetical protein [Noviherbaspirillum sp.]